MMFVLLVKNTMEINHKLSDPAQHSQTRPVVYNTPPAAMLSRTRQIAEMRILF